MVNRIDLGSFDYKGVAWTVAPDVSLADLLPQKVAGNSPRPDTARPALAAMRKSNELPHDLMGGTIKMQERCRRWLPQEEEETPKNYAIRVSRSTLFPYYKEALLGMAARPFGQPITWDEDPTPEWDRFTKDIDGTGRDITVFARDSLLNAMHRGMEHVLVDATAESGETVESTKNRKVYATRIDPLSMLDIRDEADIDGNKHVTYCRFITTVSEDNPDDEFSQKVEVVIVELKKPIVTMENVGLADREKSLMGSRVEWRFNGKSNKWFKASEESYNPGKKGIPLFTFYTHQVEAYHATPVLEDLAWINLAHFQSRSDHAHVMRIARLITLVLTGFKKAAPGDAQAKGESNVVLGPLSKIESGNDKARAVFLEPSGTSIELSFKDQEQLDQEAKRLGSRHVTSQTGDVTARAVVMDDVKTTSNLQTFCVRLDVFLRQILEAYAEWVGIEIPDDMMPRTNKEFSAAGNIEEGSRALAALGDSLSTRKKLEEAKRYTILSPGFDIEENMKERDDEAQRALERMAELSGEGGDPDAFGAGVDPEDDPKKSKPKKDDKEEEEE